ncbi:glycosyltransferase family 4 protein [Lachnospira pectinoschiza]|uniref:glycosyltransferase family 4 protein n=1 Tax=Lachnospira pectinoschiza TaxID=28052 RepID=UPI001D099ADB|nr:glycosyltransferase family 4 protein [Lachnospira pectinoschiza]MCB6142729.1 glycosyltransferase family 4 protein [Lachnospira pectinoschiza]
MNLSGQNVLLFTRTMGLGGTENVVLQLCEILKPQVHNIVVCSCGGVNVEKLDTMGIKHYTVPDITIKNPITVIKIVTELKRIIRQEKITVIHSHHRMAAFYARVVANSNIIQIVNAHNTFYDKKTLTKIAYKKANIIAVGEQVKKNMVEYFGISADKVAVIHNAIKPFEGPVVLDTELEQARQQGYTLVGNIGRLSEQKGIEYFIKAAALVYKENPNIRFYIVGDGEDAEKLKKLTDSLLPEGILTFMGYRSDIQNVMSQMDFIVLSSLWEGLPLTPIEAFSVGKTVIATNVDGTPEIVKDGENGLLVHSADEVQIAQKILYICKEQSIRQKLEENAVKTYEKRFTIDTMKERYIQYYKSVIG